MYSVEVRNGLYDIERGIITFNTLYKDYKWKVIGAFVATTKAKDDNGYVFNYICLLYTSVIKISQRKGSSLFCGPAQRKAAHCFHHVKKTIGRRIMIL